MATFDFLRSYVNALPSSKLHDPEHGFVLRPALSQQELERISTRWQIDLPEEMRALFMSTYGGQFGEYELLTVPRMKEMSIQLEAIYEDRWNTDLLPIFLVRGTGDSIAMDLSDINADGHAQILDGFHEVPPEEWTKLGYGLRNWLLRMAENDFRPFWL